MKILFITTVGSTTNFFKDIIKIFVQKDVEIDIATNTNIADVPKIFYDYGCIVYKIDCERTPFSLSNIKAIKQIKDIVNDGDYEIVHCHTPVASICTRIACVFNKKTKVIYTAHGFHFYKGAPIKNWLLYFPFEWFCSFFTDVLITMNNEDYLLANKYLHAKKNEFVNGVGINVERFSKTNINIESKKKELGIPKDAFVILSVGELNENKNHSLVIKTLKEINNEKIYYLVTGTGKLKNKLNSIGYSKLILLGKRNDVNELLKISDLFIMPSLREGLPVSLMEAVASGTDCLSTRIRGCVDILGKNEDCYFDNAKELKDKILLKMNNNIRFLKYPCEFDYSKEAINKEMLRIYSEI